MTVSLDKAGKKFYREWIFRNLSFEFSPSEKYALLGPNGSGKSTLLKVISGSMIPTEGIVTFGNGAVNPDDVYRDVNIAAPYLELIEEFTMEEMIRFHFGFRKPVSGLSEADVTGISGLAGNEKKFIRYFSSGMKQRLKLSLAILSESKMLLLDEPCTNLDQNTVQWYHSLLDSYTAGRLVIVASNHHEDEIRHCNVRLNMNDWK